MTKDLKILFPILHNYLNYDENHGIEIISTGVNSSSISKKPSLLKHYYVNEETEKIIINNIKWAQGEITKPIFQFAYLMLPTKCNQSCKGCFMGQDKSNLPEYYDGSDFSERELYEICSFLRNHGAKSVVYGGVGELFNWKGAFKFIEIIQSYGLDIVIFTNGTLLSQDDVIRLNEAGVTLIISLRDTIEKFHNQFVGTNNFLKSLLSIEYALSIGMQEDNRLSVEIPVTKLNGKRVLLNFIPAMRGLGIVPMVEEYIQISVSNEEQALSHDFKEAREFINLSRNLDMKLGVNWIPEVGTRIIGQPKCKRPLYSFAIFPNRNIMDCPSHSVSYGNLFKNSIDEIIYSDNFRNEILNFSLCACSVFYTNSNLDLPVRLPNYLEALI
ncbi:MAG: radical SAM protein [Bacteroidales bacterium]|jgi:MoaA/NifB/PqqE/SkfB family radical SAM enzyme